VPTLLQRGAFQVEKEDPILADLPDNVRSFFREPNFVHFAMLREDGSPQVAVVWADLDEHDPNRIVISTNEGSPKIRAVRRDPRVALSVTRLHDPYDEAYLRGRVVEIRKEGAPARMQAISRKYTGKDFPWPVDQQVLIVIEVDEAKSVKLPFEAPK
jgi:PPOX class probable F420-dependent enzyme